MTESQGFSLVWYVGYGSNLWRERFLLYLIGGELSVPDPGSGRTIILRQSGARDRRPPMDDRAYVLRGTLKFGLRSPVWGHSGVAVFAKDESAEDILGRAYLITWTQLEDVVAQESFGSARHVDPRILIEAGRLSLSDRWFSTLELNGFIDRVPAVSLRIHDIDDLKFSPPSWPYLSCMARGLQVAHGLSNSEIANYLINKGHLRDRYSEQNLLNLLAELR